MKFILEYKSYYKENQIVLVEYWYNHMITPVIIEKISGKKATISHNIEQSKIKNAPKETIRLTDIIDNYRLTNS
jgi:hypothetical protein